MKALTVKQPWAHAICLGFKTIEIRSWSTPYRGDLLITSSQKPVVAFQGEALDSGVTICVVSLVDCKPTRKQDARHSLIDYEEGQISWFLKFKYRVKPVSIKGKLGLWIPDMKLITKTTPHPKMIKRK